MRLCLISDLMISDLTILFINEKSDRKHPLAIDKQVYFFAKRTEETAEQGYKYYAGLQRNRGIRINLKSIISNATRNMNNEILFMPCIIFI